MRGDIVYHVYGVHAGRDKDVYFGAFRTVLEAEAEIAKLRAKEMNGRNWAEQYHNSGFVIRDVTVETDFEVPARPAPPRQVLRRAHAENQTGANRLDHRRCISPQHTRRGRGKGLPI